jgi:hypothetical protein
MNDMPGELLQPSDDVGCERGTCSVFVAGLATVRSPYGPEVWRLPGRPKGHPPTHPTDNVQGRSPYAGRDSMGALSRISPRENPL